MGKRTHLHRSRCPNKNAQNHIRNVMHHMVAHTSDILRQESCVLDCMRRHEPIPDEAIILLQTARENLHRAKSKLAFLTDPQCPAACVCWDDTGLGRHRVEYITTDYNLLQRCLRKLGFEYRIGYEAEDFDRYDRMCSGHGRDLPQQMEKDDIENYDPAHTAVKAWEISGRPGPYGSDEHPPDDTAVDDKTADTADTAAPAVTASSHQKAPATTSSPTEESVKQFLWRYWGRLPPPSADTAPEPRKVLHTRPTSPKTPPDANHYWRATSRTAPPPGGRCPGTMTVEYFGESESDTDDVPDRGPTTLLDRRGCRGDQTTVYTGTNLYGCKFEQSVQTVYGRYSERPCGPLYGM